MKQKRSGLRVGGVYSWHRVWLISPVKGIGPFVTSQKAYSLKTMKPRQMEAETMSCLLHNARLLFDIHVCVYVTNV